MKPSSIVRRGYSKDLMPLARRFGHFAGFGSVMRPGRMAQQRKNKKYAAVTTGRRRRGQRSGAGASRRPGVASLTVRSLTGGPVPAE